MSDADTGTDESEPRTPATVSEDDEKILAELNERFDYALQQWQPILDEGNIDVRYAAGKTFDAKDLETRGDRLTVELDQLSQYTNQLVNSFRQNPRAAKVSPAGSGATDKTAELRANRIRQIEHDSHAQEVYTVAGENAATRGYGYARIVAEYEDGQSANQVLRLKAIPNPNQVLPDPDAESTAGADWQYLFFVHTITRREFRRDYPDAQITDFSPELTASVNQKWFGQDGRVQIAEYWSVTETAPKGGVGRPTKTVCQYVTNGVELLHKRGQPKKTEWRGSSIPFATCVGKIIYQTDDQGGAQKMLQSYIRLARDAAKAYNWTASTELEALALPVKAALFAYVGQLGPEDVALVERSTREPIALIQAKATTEATGQAILPLPQYGTRAPDIQGYEIARESFRRDVQNALGRYSVQDHRLGGTKVTSGAALRELDKSGDLGSYHFVAHYDDMIRELCVKLNELLDVYDDTDKEVSTRKPDQSTAMVAINRPTGRDAHGNPAYGPDDLRMAPEHRHTVTIATGPALDSERDANSAFADHVIDNPQLPQIVGPEKAAALIALAIKLKGAGAIGDQMAEIVHPTETEGGPPNPEQLQQENQELKGKLQELDQAMQQAQQELQTKAAEQQAKVQIAQMELQSKDQNAEADRQQALHLQQMKDATAIEVARIGAEKDMGIAAQEAEEEALALNVKFEHAVILQDRQHAHAETLNHTNNAAKAEQAERASKTQKTIAFHRDASGNTEGATISGADQGDA